MKPAPLYHIVSKDDWRKYRADGAYRPPSLGSEGFIHLSTREQVLDTANAFFKGQPGLLLLELHLAPNDSAIRWEPAAGPGVREGLFPHYYSALPIEAVKKIHAFEPTHEGTFVFPSAQ
jgi:uncharacterized protein (DUF952 family)